MAESTLVGKRAVVIDPMSSFKGREGTIVEQRPPPLPYGIKLDDQDEREGLLWLDYREMEWFNAS